MHTTHFWHKLNLHRSKIASVLLISFILIGSLSHGQRMTGMNNPDYDSRFLSYGFLIGLHTASYQMKYSQEFLDINDLHSIQPKFSPGFSLGFIVNMHVADYLDIRVLPKVAFYEHEIDYLYTDESVVTQLVESTVVEFPIVMKYSSVRRGNVRMYMVGGLKPGIEASAKNSAVSEDDLIPVNKANLSFDFGVGFDLYYPLFKFSPELRFSKGLPNMLGAEVNQFSTGISSLKTNTITLYLLFQ